MEYLDIGPVTDRGEIPIIEPYESVVAYVFQEKEGDYQSWEYARLFAKSPEMYYLLSDILSALNWGRLSRPKEWEARIQQVIEDVSGEAWVNYAKKPMPR